MTYEWVDVEQFAVSQRYDALAGLIPFFERLLFLPNELRGQAVARLSLQPGDRVLEVGCGTGRNFRHLVSAVGRSGQIYGVDLSAGMLQRADALRARHGWANIRLMQGDAAYFVAPQQLAGVLFSLSYNTMHHHRQVLAQAWKQLRPGGRLVIMDAKVPPGVLGKLVLPFSVWLMRHTLLGNPYIRPWEELRKLTATAVNKEEFRFGSYYICHVQKPSA